MRILLITGSFPPMRCGVGDYTQRLAAALAAHDGVEVAVLTSRAAAGSTATPGVTVFPVVEQWRVRDLYSIARMVSRWKPDVVHVQYPTQGYSSGSAAQLLPVVCRLLGFGVAQTWHEYRRHITLRALIWVIAEFPVSGSVVFVRPGFEEVMPPLLRHTLRRKTRAYIPLASAIPRVQLSPAEKASVRARYVSADAALVVYFGFMHPAKGVEQLFKIAHPDKHHLVIVGEIREGDEYHARVKALSRSDGWAGRVTLTGFLSAEDVGRVIAAADAVVLPFVGGGGEWNSSMQGARAQGTFIVTTSNDRHGYDPAQNTYFARPGDVDEMRKALNEYGGRRAAAAESSTAPTWESISAAHLALYSRLVAA